MLSPRRKRVNLLYRRHPHHYKPKLCTLSALCSISLLLFLNWMIFDNKIIIIGGGNETEYLTRGQIQGRDSHYSKDYDNFWTRISDSLHVYSAHLDSRSAINDNLTLIRIIGIKRVPSMKSILRRNPLEWFRLKDETYYGDKFVCKVFISRSVGTVSFEELQGDILTYTIIEEGVKSFAACYVNCYINSTKFQQNKSDSDVFIAVYPLNVKGYPDKLIPVEMAMNLEQKSRTLGLCVRPLFGPMDDLSKIIQFVSYYQTMGVTSMTFYDLSISPRIRTYLMNLGTTENFQVNLSLKRWNLPTGNTSELWDYGSLAALNDCLFRRMEDGHVIFVDIDEFIVPQMDRHKSLHDLINFYEVTSPNFYQLLIRNAFFCQEFCLYEQNASRHIGTKMNFNTNVKEIYFGLLRIGSCTIRAKRVLNVNLRSKFIVKPKKIISVGHHLVTKFVDKVDHRFTRNSIEGRTDVVLLNHYRDCSSISTRQHPILNRLTVQDQKILRFLGGNTHS